MAKGERPKREGRTAKKVAPKSVNLSSSSIGSSSDVEVIRKKRKPKEEDD